MKGYRISKTFLPYCLSWDVTAIHSGEKIDLRVIGSERHLIEHYVKQAFNGFYLNRKKRACNLYVKGK
jgi:hypothetical protein